MQTFGVNLDPSGLNITRILGGYNLGIAVIAWVYKDADYPTIEGLLLGFFIGDAAGLLLSVKAQLEGLLNPLGWLIVAILLFLSVGSGYYRFVKPGTKLASPRAV